MFGRLLWHLLRGNRVRMTVALMALISGGTVISALLNLDLDVTRKLTQEFRSLGANLVISAPQAAGPESPVMVDESLLQNVDELCDPEVVAAPYLYVVARAGTGQEVVVTGTWLDRMRQLAPWWKITGDAGISRDDTAHCLVGRNANRSLGLAPGKQVTLRYQGRSVALMVAGVIDAGGSEDNQIFVNLPVAQKLAGLPGKIEAVQLSVPGSAEQIRHYASRLASALPLLEVHPVRQIAKAEGELLGRIRFLIVSTGILILVLTALCVLATMAALAMERRRDVGLMKAIGGSMKKVLRLFMTEVTILGVAGGILGYAFGMVLSVWMGQRVFGAEISPRWEVLPVTVALMLLVSFAGALPLRLLGNVRPAVILRGE